MKRTLLFHRDHRRFSGGHLKVFDCFRHALQSQCFVPSLYLTPQSQPDGLWSGCEPVVRYDPERADALFIAGVDWRALEPFGDIEERVPVINLIQHVRHADPADPRFPFLARRAIRICVSQAVADAIAATGRCNGPVHVIPGGIDLAGLAPPPIRDVDVLIAGLKQPELASDVAAALTVAGASVDCAITPLPRREFLQGMGRARVAITLPDASEGLFLPALEAMALGCALVCPDCIGNRDFCRDDATCLMPPPTSPALAAAAMKLLADPELSARLRAGAANAVQDHDLNRERVAFLRILDGV